MIPDLADWTVSILATDINVRFLDRAAEGVYGEWSFRAAPEWVRRYFTSTSKGKMRVSPQIKRMVSFSYLNLAEDTYPSLGTATNAMDVGLCRNVLMYFTPECAHRVIQNLFSSLVENGWLLVGAAEASQALFSRFAAVNHPGAVLYRKASRGESLADAAPSIADTGRVPEPC